MRSFRLLIPIACLAAVGCALNEARSPRVLDALDSVVFSNEPTLAERPQPRFERGRVEFDYALLVENRGMTPAAVDLMAARAALSGDTKDQESMFRVVCHEHQKHRRSAPVTLLGKGERARIDCRVTLSREQTESVANADREVVIGLPLFSGDHVTGMYFEYRLHSWDAR